MKLFTSELFSPVMPAAPRPPRSYRAPAFARRYGRVAARSEQAPANNVHLMPCAVARVEPQDAAIAYDRAA